MLWQTEVVVKGQREVSRKLEHDSSAVVRFRMSDRPGTCLGGRGNGGTGVSFNCIIDSIDRVEAGIWNSQVK